jgi:hypothetical protein
MQDGLRYRKPAWFDKAYQILLVSLIIISSGFPLFVNNSRFEMVILAVITAGVAYYRPNLRTALIYTACFSMIMFIQGAWYGVFYFKTAIYQVLLFFAAAASVSVLGINLIYTYNKILLIIAAIAVVLFTPILINPAFVDKLIAMSPVHTVSTTEVYGWKTQSHNILLMHFPPDFFMGLIRNSGPFWEPGAFGGYLMLALIFNTLLHHTLFRKENLIYLAAILTTFSTTTYLALLFFTMAYFFIGIKNPIIKWGSLIVFLLIAFISFQKIDFLGEKISKELRETKYQALKKGGDTRMASAYLDLKEVQENAVTLFFGRGSHPDTRIQGPDKEVLRTNGITDLLSRFGLIFFLFSIVALYFSYRHLASAGKKKNQLALAALVTTMLLSFSEIYFIYLMFKTLTLFHIATLHLKKKQAPLEILKRQPRVSNSKTITNKVIIS